MEIVTQFGTQDVDPDTLITFTAGMPGFENLTRFKLFHEEGKSTVFWLQAVDDPDVQFAIADPAMFNVTYEITLSDDEVATLQLASAEDLTVLVTLAKPLEQAAGIHANFMGPILINMRERLGMQKLLNQVESSVLIRAH